MIVRFRQFRDDCRQKLGLRRTAIALSVCLWPCHTIIRSQGWFPARWDTIDDWAALALTAMFVGRVLQNAERARRAAETRIAALSRALCNAYEGAGKPVPPELAESLPVAPPYLRLVPAATVPIRARAVE